MYRRGLVTLRTGQGLRTSRGSLITRRFNSTEEGGTAAPKRRMPSIWGYFRTNPSAPVVFLVAWSLSLLGGLVMEKNQYEDMKNKGEKHIAVLRELIERTKRGEAVNVEEELAIVNDQSRSVDEILQEIEKLDQEWSSSVEKQIDAPEQAQPKHSKSRSDVKGTFV